jgi:DNA-binding CsgD family transcriptional regulator
MDKSNQLENQLENQIGRAPANAATVQQLPIKPAARTHAAPGEHATTSPFKALLQTIVAREAEPAATPYVTADVLAFLLDIQSAPSLIVDRKLRIIFANVAAETALRQGGSLRRQGHDLIVHSAQARTFAACVNAAGRGCPLKRSLILEGGAGRQDLAVWFRPIDASLQTSSRLWGHGLISISVRVLSRPPVLSSALLRQHYGLTVRQAEVASRLALGASLNTIENEMGIKITTLRSHLSKAFQKTHTRGQSELIALVLSLTSPVLE